MESLPSCASSCPCRFFSPDMNSPKKKMRPVKAWAITTPKGRLLEISRTYTKGKRRAFWNAPSILVPVLISELPSRKPKKKK